MKEAQIKLGLREIWHDIRNGAARNDAWIDGYTLAPAVELLELQNLVRKLDDGVMAFLGFNTGMGGQTFRGKRIPGVAFTGAHDVTISAGSLQYQRTLAVLHHAVQNVLTVASVDLLIRDAEETQFVIAVITKRLQGFNGIDSRENAALHIADARAINGIPFNAQRTRGGSPLWINGIDMAKQQDVAASSSLR